MAYGIPALAEWNKQVFKAELLPLNTYACHMYSPAYFHYGRYFSYNSLHILKPPLQVAHAGSVQ